MAEAANEILDAPSMAAACASQVMAPLLVTLPHRASSILKQVSKAENSVLGESCPDTILLQLPPLYLARVPLIVPVELSHVTSSLMVLENPSESLQPEKGEPLASEKVKSCSSEAFFSVVQVESE